MKIISYNINGIRAALKKGLDDWLAAEQPDVLCLQETKANEDQVNPMIFEELGYKYRYWFSAQKPGYSGVAIFSKVEPDLVQRGMELADYDREGRVLRADFGDWTLLNCYFPSGSSGDLRQEFKYRFLDDFYSWIEAFRKERPNLLICGDYNICHKAIDIHNPVSNKNSSGFLPEERAWMDKFTESGFADAFRSFHPEPHRYSWWSYRASARQKNLGWRIDYFMVSSPFAEKVADAEIYDQVVHSDHCPVMVKLNL